MKRHNLEIAEPCSASWSEMHGDERTRFCTQCAKHVHDLSAMTPQEAQSVVSRPGNGRLCIRYAENPDGSIRFRARGLAATSPMAQQRGALQLVQSAAGVASLLLALVSNSASAESEVWMGQEPALPTDAVDPASIQNRDDVAAEPCEASGEGSGAMPPGIEEQVQTPDVRPDDMVQGGLPVPEDLLREFQSTPKMHKTVAPLALQEQKAGLALERWGIVVEDTTLVTSDELRRSR